MKKTWVLIANASEARLFEGEKSSNRMILLAEFFHPESREKISDLVVNNRGRYRDMKNAPSGVYQEPTNPRQVEAEKFAYELASTLNKGRVHHKFNRLILIAPSQFQGLLNKFCNHHVKHLIMNTIDKDYTKVKENQLSKYLNGKLRLQTLEVAA